FVLPSVLIISFGFFAFREGTPDDKGVVDKLIAGIKQLTLRIRPSAIVTLTVVSLFAYSISNFLPSSFKQIGVFLYNSLFAGLFYIVYKKDFPLRPYYICGILGF